MLNEAIVPRRMKVARALPVHPDIVATTVIFERDVQWLMDIANPMP
jgi:hypothetical protein